MEKIDWNEKKTFKIVLDKGKLILGIICSIVCLISCYLCQCSMKLGIAFSIMVIAVSSVRICIENNYIIRVINGLWFVISAFVSVFLTQLLMNTGVFSMNIFRFILGMVCCLIVIMLFFLITLNCKLAVSVGTLCLMIFTTVNYFVFTFRGGGLTPTDFLALGTALNVVEHYNFVVSNTMLYAWIFYILFLFVGNIFPNYQLSSRKVKKRAIISVTECILIGLFILGGRNLNPLFWNLTGVEANGVLLNFALQLRSTFVSKPEGYSVENVNQYAEMYNSSVQNTTDEDSVYPDIIVIMDESFADLSVLGSELRTNMEVTPFWDSLQDNTIRGYALSSIFGGMTPNSEYEFLSGNTMSFLPTGSIAYQQYIKDSSYSMVANLKKMGYYCSATHPYLESGWARTTVYPFLGFNEMTFLDSYPQKNMIREYVSDQEMFEQIVKQYEECKQENERQFIFGVSMQNHGGYDYSGNDFETEIHLNGYSQDYPDAEQYLSLIHKTDKALEYLISYFQNVDKPVVVVFYGDHLPKLNNSFYEELHGGTFKNLDEQMLQYKVPFLIWTNYDIEEQYIECTSLNYLSNYLYEAAEISLPAYNKFTSEVEKRIPAINALGYYSLEKESFIPLDDADGQEKEILIEYEQFQYNCIFDKQNRNSIIFANP